jgi:hypothetical protein
MIVVRPDAPRPIVGYSRSVFRVIHEYDNSYTVMEYTSKYDYNRGNYPNKATAEARLKELMPPPKYTIEPLKPG